METVARVAILHPTDPAGHVPGGIDSFIRGILKWAPDDLEYTLFGATSDFRERPIGQEVTITLGHRQIRYLPLVSVDPSSTRHIVPLTLRYMWALARLVREGQLVEFDILDFHRIEPVYLFRSDERPKNVVIHQDMAVLRDESSDIMWRHMPWLYEVIERRLLEGVNRIFSVRQTALRRYSEAYPHWAEKLSFIPTWVDSTIFHPAPVSEEGKPRPVGALSLLGVDDKRTVLIFVGRLDRQKDPLLLLDSFQLALKRRTNLHLVIVGDGALRSRVEVACRSGCLRGRVSMLGAKPARDVAELLRASDLFVMSSAYEGMPIALLEALATGLPAVCTDVGEVRLLIRDGVNGQIAPERTAVALANSICSALNQIELLRGEPCVASAAPYHAERVLSRLYENHRSQTKLRPEGSRDNSIDRLLNE